MARLRLKMWDTAIDDCLSCLKMGEQNMKALFTLSQAQVELHDYDRALENALKAYKLCVEGNDKSLPLITNHILRCKKERWDEAEKRRVREAQDLENDIASLIERERHGMLQVCDDDIGRWQIEEEFNQKTSQLRDIFERARTAAEKKRTVPAWAIDDISFEIMVDPVIVRPSQPLDGRSQY